MEIVKIDVTLTFRLIVSPMRSPSLEERPGDSTARDVDVTTHAQ